MPQTARELGFARLYHYQRYNRDHLATTLQNNTLHFSTPANFNDPWDCKPWFDLDALARPEVRDATIDYLMRVGKATQQSDADEMRSNPTLLRAMVHGVADGIIETLAQDYRVLCLTPEDLSIRMWSYYAEKHTGICLQFDTHHFPFNGAMKVEYLPEFPLGQMSDSEENEVRRALLVKAREWEFENEFRVIALVRSEERRDGPILADGNFVDIPPESLTSVVVGCNCPFGDEIVDLVQRLKPGVTVRQTVRLPHVFGLGYRTLHEGEPRAAHSA